MLPGIPTATSVNAAPSYARPPPYLRAKGLGRGCCALLGCSMVLVVPRALPSTANDSNAKVAILPQNEDRPAKSQQAIANVVIGAIYEALVKAALKKKSGLPSRKDMANIPYCLRYPFRVGHPYLKEHMSKLKL